MHIRIEVADPALNDTRAHYCAALHRFIGLRYSGVDYPTDVYCPRCGVVVPHQEPGHNFARTVRPEMFEGPRCPHGYADVSAMELYDSDEKARYELLCAAIREFRAAVLARRYGGAPAVLAWVRPCPHCRKANAQMRAPRLRHELGQLGKALRAELKSAEKRLARLRDDLVWLHEAFLELEFQLLTETGDPVRMGFVYLIGHSRAVKIGWSEQHPAKPGGRLSNLQSASSDDLQLVGVIEGPYSLEREIQRRFAVHHLRGEWFANDREILEYFATNGTPS